MGRYLVIKCIGELKVGANTLPSQPAHTHYTTVTARPHTPHYRHSPLTHTTLLSQPAHTHRPHTPHYHHSPPTHTTLLSQPAHTHHTTVTSRPHTHCMWRWLMSSPSTPPSSKAAAVFLKRGSTWYSRSNVLMFKLFTFFSSTLFTPLPAAWEVKGQKSTKGNRKNNQEVSYRGQRSI